MEKTIDEILNTIRAAGDSVWVIENEIQKTTESNILTDESRGNIERNISHLNYVVKEEAIIESGEDISHLIAAISLGNEFLEAHPTE